MKKTLSVLLLNFIFIFTSCASLSTDNIQSLNSKEDIKSSILPFYSDGCSKWPEGTKDKPYAWLGCCFEHDKAYWMGGTKSERKMADTKLKQCVSKNFSNWMGVVMYLGVRVGGRPGFDTDYRWGYGWKENRGYAPLTEYEREILESYLPTAEEDIWDYITIPHYEKN